MKDILILLVRNTRLIYRDIFYFVQGLNLKKLFLHEMQFVKLQMRFSSVCPCLFPHLFAGLANSAGLLDLAWLIGRALFCISRPETAAA